MKGAKVFYRVPCSTGWLVLEGTIAAIHDTAIVVREKTFGGRSTIDPTWLVSYIWPQTQTAEAVASAAA